MGERQKKLNDAIKDEMYTKMKNCIIDRVLSSYQ